MQHNHIETNALAEVRGRRNRRAEDNEPVVGKLDVTGIPARRLVSRELNRVGHRMAARERWPGLERRRVGRRAGRPIALAHDVRDRARREGSARDAMREERTALGQPLTVHQQLGRSCKPRAHLEEDAGSGLRGGRLVELGVNLPCGTVGVLAVAKAHKEPGVVVDERGENLHDRARGRRRLAGRGQEALLGLGSTVGRKHPLDLLRNTVAAAEQLEARHPEGAGSGKAEDHHQAGRDETFEPVATGKRR